MLELNLGLPDDQGASPARLGDLTLRVETAAAAMLAAVTAFLTD